MALLNLPDYMKPAGTIKQYGANEGGAGAAAQRKWWQTAMQPATTAAAKPSALTSPASTDSTKPTMELLKAVKNPGIAKAGESLLSQFNLNMDASKNNSSEFADRAALDMGTDRAALDTTDFAKTLANIRSQQESKIRQQAETDLLAGVGNLERLKAIGGGNMGLSSDDVARLGTLFAANRIPVEQQILSQRAADAASLYEANRANVGARAGIEEAYQRRLQLPAQLRGNLLQQQMASVSGLASIDNANTNYQNLVSKQYEPNNQYLPVYPVNGSSYVPPVRSLPPLNYGLLNQQQNPPPVGGDGGQQQVGRRRSQAEEDYRRDTGYYPQDDPNFNTMLWESYGGRIGQRPAQAAPAPIGRQLMDDETPGLLEMFEADQRNRNTGQISGVIDGYTPFQGEFE